MFQKLSLKFDVSVNFRTKPKATATTPCPSSRCRRVPWHPNVGKPVIDEKSIRQAYSYTERDVQHKIQKYRSNLCFSDAPTCEVAATLACDDMPSILYFTKNHHREPADVHNPTPTCHSADIGPICNPTCRRAAWPPFAVQGQQIRVSH